MTAKYSTDDMDATMHHEDWRHVLLEHETKPFVGHRHRHETVEERLVVEYTHGVGVDITWEARSEDSGKIPDEWSAVERIEVRDYGLHHERRPERRWLA